MGNEDSLSGPGEGEGRRLGRVRGCAAGGGGHGTFAGGVREGQGGNRVHVCVCLMILRPASSFFFGTGVEGKPKENQSFWEFYFGESKFQCLTLADCLWSCKVTGKRHGHRTAGSQPTTFFRETLWCRVPLFDYPSVDLNPGVVHSPKRRNPGFKSILG